VAHTVDIPIRLLVRPKDPEGLARAADVLTEEMRAAVSDCVLHVQERVKKIIEVKDIINEGHLINSIASAMGFDAGVIVGQVGTNLTYAKYQEFGTIPHFVPFHLAKSLYNQAIGDWGWIPVDKTESKRLNAVADPRVQSIGRGMRVVTGRRQTYLNPDGKIWAKPYEDAKPVWGIFVTGRKQPFMYPGWIESLAFITERLAEGGRRAAERLNTQGGE
jgi:hypothetical protein